MYLSKKWHFMYDVRVEFLLCERLLKLMYTYLLSVSLIKYIHTYTDIVIIFNYIASNE